MLINNLFFWKIVIKLLTTIKCEVSQPLGCVTTTTTTAYHKNARRARNNVESIRGNYFSILATIQKKI